MTITLNGTSGITTPGLDNTGSTTLDTGTANGVAYLNGSKVLTTGSALAFDGTNFNINSGGWLKFNSANTVYSSAGVGFFLQAPDTGSTPLQIRSSVGQVWASFSNTDIISYIGSAEQMRLNGTGLGIGTSSPAYKLDVANSGDVSSRVSSTGTNNAASLILQSGSGATSGLFAYARFINNDSNAQDWRIGTYGTNNLSIVNAKAGTTPVVIDTSGNVGIGTTSPQQRLHVNQAQAGGFGGCILVGNSAGQAGDTSGIYGTYDGASAPFRGGIMFHSGETGAVSIHTGNNNDAGSGICATFSGTDHTAKFYYTVSVGGATPTTSGAGVTFPATQSASSDANTLDDYEEGTFTVTDGSGAGLSFTNNTGYYIKVGSLVTLWFDVTYPSTANTSTARINLPFTSINGGSGNSGGGACTYVAYSTGVSVYWGSTTSMIFYTIGGGAIVQNNNLSNKELSIMFTYRTAA